MENTVLKSSSWERKDFDFIIKVENDNRIIPCHRSMLKADFEPFMASVGDKNEIVLKGVGYEAVNLIIEMIYTGQVSDRDDYSTFAEAIEFANKSRMDSVAQKMSLWAERNPSVAIYAECGDKLTGNAKSVLIKHIQQGISSVQSEISKLTFDQFQEVMKRQSVSPLKQDVALTAIKKWVLACPGERYQHSFELLSTIVFDKDLKTETINEEILPICKTLESLNFLVELLVNTNRYQVNRLEEQIRRLTPKISSMGD